MNLKRLHKKLAYLPAQLVYLRRTLALIWGASGQLSIAWGILLALQGLLPAASLYITRWLVDSLVTSISATSSWADIKPLVMGAVLMAGLMILGLLLQSLNEWVNVAQSEIISDHLQTTIHQKAAQVDLIFYELSEYNDLLEQAKSQGSSRPLILLQNFGNLFRDTIAVAGMGFVLMAYGLWLPLILFLSSVPAFLVVVFFNRISHRWWEETTSQRRWTNYYDQILTSKEAAPEMRLFNLSGYFQTSYQDIRRQLRTERLDLTKRQTIARLAVQFATLIFFALTMIWMAWRALSGIGTLGDIALFFQAFNQGQGLLQSLLRSVANIYNDTLFLNNLFRFLDYEPQIVDPAQPVPVPDRLKHGIAFKHISFNYPGSDRQALNDFNLTIDAGTTVAIVGANGAGKSTLIKLLCRFYDPDAGSIELDGIDIRDFPVVGLRRLIAVLFQHAMSYRATARQNILFGDVSITPTPDQVEAIAHSAGAHDAIVKLPQGYDTLLGKIFLKSEDLSGGEWQRLALARTLFRQAPIIVLDEPTSALDSWSEADWYSRFRTVAAGCTSIIITHRFTIAKDADVIHVMEAGKIVESGSHQELLALNGLYARSWRQQTQVKSTAAAHLDTEQPGSDYALAAAGVALYHQNINGH
ncbi:MAG: ABC transporter ATP-binding protein [Anaerolineae bacterium]|nr:ABC transporter ATP-binding protein [Anaerolineae bacterium]